MGIVGASSSKKPTPTSVPQFRGACSWRAVALPFPWDATERSKPAEPGRWAEFSDLFLTSQCSFPNGHSRREGLGLDDRRARRHARPPRLGRFRRPGLLPSDSLLVDGLAAATLSTTSKPCGPAGMACIHPEGA